MKEDSNLSVVVESNTEQIQNLIYVIRGKQVLLDSDLAMLYHVETRTLNQAVKRNISRFPERFRFQLTKSEFENLKSQNVTLSSGDNYGGRRFMPYAFTEQGIAMLSSVLKSDVAVQVSINIMDTFVEIRKYMADTVYLFKQVNDVVARQIESDIKREAFEKKTEEQLAQVFKYISDHEEDSRKIFFDGQIFDAFSLMTDIVQQANKDIVLIDGYVDMATLNILAKKKNGVDVTFYTLPNTKLTAQDIANFNAQYPNLVVRHTTAFHDRFMIIDRSTAYHIGASIKDAGKKCFGINKIEDIGIINDLLQRAELTF
ncbi:MAG: ORF6N domain-containing protein [Clostridiales bacterium]|nr:ORF6N domain-containing protein [Clostridiales bacterium]